MNEIGYAYLGSFIAGAATGIGALVALISSSKRMYAFASAFSAGAMLWISFAEIYLSASLVLKKHFPQKEAGSWISLGSFFLGYVITKIIDHFIPEPKLGELEGEKLGSDEIEARQLSMMRRTGFLNWVVLAVHNIPEGLASFISWSGSLGLGLIIAISFHNICEGFCIAAALNSSKMKKWKCILYTFLSGMTELLGATVGHMIKAAVSGYEDQWPIEIVLMAVAGIMTCVSLENLLKQAIIFEEKHELFTGLISGMFLMGVTIIILAYWT